MSSGKLRYLYGGLVVAMVLCTLLGLVCHVKTIALNREIRTLTVKHRHLVKENTRMQYDILAMNRLDRLEQIATSKLNLVLPLQIHYFSNNADRQKN